MLDFPSQFARQLKNDVSHFSVWRFMDEHTLYIYSFLRKKRKENADVAHSITYQILT